MIRVLLFLRAWHAELRLWKHGLRHSMKLDGALEEDALYRMREFVDRCWKEVSMGYVQHHR